jgi:hypothetical protein
MPPPQIPRVGIAPPLSGKDLKIARQVFAANRSRVDMESVKHAYRALPYARKFFWMIYRLSPVRTVIIIFVYLLQGLLPALRLRTGGDFIKQVKGMSMRLANVAAARGDPVRDDEFKEPSPSCHHPGIHVHSRTERLESFVSLFFAFVV